MRLPKNRGIFRFTVLSIPQNHAGLLSDLQASLQRLESGGFEARSDSQAIVQYVHQRPEEREESKAAARAMA